MFEFNEPKLYETEKKSTDFFTTLSNIYTHQVGRQVAKLIINIDYNPVDVDYISGFGVSIIEIVKKDISVSNRNYKKELAINVLTFLSKLSNNLYNVTTRFTDTKVEIKRLGLYYNMPSKFQLEHVMNNCLKSFSKPWQNCNNFGKLGLSGQFQIFAGFILSPFIGSCRLSADIFTYMSNLIMCENTLINVRCLPSYNGYINSSQMKINQYQHLASYVSILARRFWSIDSNDLKIEYIICMKTLAGIDTMQYVVFTTQLLMLVSDRQLQFKFNVLDIVGLEFYSKNKIYNCAYCDNIINYFTKNCDLKNKIEVNQNHKSYKLSMCGKQTEKTKDFDMNTHTYLCLECASHLCTNCLKHFHGAECKYHEKDHYYFYWRDEKVSRVEYLINVYKLVMKTKDGDEKEIEVLEINLLYALVVAIFNHVKYYYRDKDYYKLGVDHDS